MNPVVSAGIVRRVRALLTLRILVLLLFACVNVGCTLPKTFYSLDRVYTQDGKPQVLIHKGRLWFSFLAPQDESKNYIADVVPEADSGGAVQLVNTRHLADDGADEKSNFTFANGTQQVVQIQDRRNSSIFPWNTSADVLDLKNRRREHIASARMVSGYPDAIAITRSGSRLLVVDGKKAVLYDPAQQKAIGQESNLLVELRRQIIEKCGIAGDWYLTENLKYVVISPPDEIYEGGGSHLYFQPTLITIAGTTVDLAGSGLVFERATGIFSVYPRAIDSDPVADVEDVNGYLQFIYARFDRAELADSSGKVLAKHSISEDVQFPNAFAGWDPSRGEIWFHSVQGKLVLDARAPEVQADHEVICWNTATDVEKRYRIAGAQIAAAIAKAL